MNSLLTVSTGNSLILLPSNDNVESSLLALKEYRDPIYNNICDYIIDVSNKEKNVIIKEIEKIIL